VTNQRQQCRVYDFVKYASKRPQGGGQSNGPAGLAHVIHFCPSYMAGFNFYKEELSALGAAVLTHIITLLSRRDFDQDQRWELLQFVTQANFVKLDEAHQWQLLAIVERMPALSIHLLLATLNNRMKKRLSNARTSLPGVTASGSISELKLKVGLETDAKAFSQFCLDQRRYTAELYEDIIATLQTLLDAHSGSAVAVAYLDLACCPAFIGSEGQLGLFLNRLILQDLSMVTPTALEKLAKVISSATFTALLLPRQRMLLESMRNLAVLEWPSAVQHLSALAAALKGASRAELTALHCYFSSSGGVNPSC